MHIGKRWRTRGLLGLAFLSLAAGVAHAPPPPPPPPEFTEKACAGVYDAKPFPTAPGRLTPLTPADIGAKGGHIGRLHWLKGVRLTAADPRFARIRGIDWVTGYGLVAVTAGGDWVSLDLHDDFYEPAPRAVSLGIAPLSTPPGEPTGLSAEAYGMAYVAFGPQGWRLYDLGMCGAAARGVDLSGGGGGQPRAETPPPFPGWRLAASSEADRFVPDYRPGVTDFYRLWQPPSGAGALIQQVLDQAPPRAVASLDRPVLAMFAEFVWGKTAQEVHITLAVEGPGGSLDIHVFAVEGTRLPLAR